MSSSRGDHRRGLALAAACASAVTLSGRSFVSSAPTTALRGATEPSQATLRRGAPTAAASEAPFPGCSTAVAGGLAAGVVAAASARRSAARKPRKQAGATALKATINIASPELEEDTLVSSANQAVVKKTSVLVLGATGTLGRQVVRQFLNAGYSVRCLIRNRADRPFSFLVDWGAQVVEGTLVRPESLPSALIGIHTVIDCSCARPEENAYAVDWEGKKNLIQCAQKMDIQRYIFMSIKDCDQFQDVPLMDIKYKTEEFLKQVGIRHTILRISGFMQPLISQYAVNVLDNQQVWEDDGSAPGTAFLDSQDCARMVLAAAAKEKCVGQTITITGPSVWGSSDVIALCEKLSGRKADRNTAPTAVLQATQAIAGLFLWGQDVAERLRFVEVTKQKVGAKETMDDTAYDLLGMDRSNTRDLEDYIGEYYRRVFKKLTKGKYEPEAGEVERERAEEEKKLAEVTRAMKDTSTDSLAPGQPAEQEVTVIGQRDMADRLQKLFEDKQLARLESPDEAWFGLTKLAELVNGRAAMMGFSLGLFTEWATDVSVSKQIDLLLAVFSSPS
mmetsp:Transcript_42826/g.126880  ORF Transcript_42826/g.126880 Transcript_42826/m.126880 type:complete len:561 (+) Transcript_42826:72-1754(+)